MSFTILVFLKVYQDGISSDHYLEQFFKLRLPGIDRLVEFVNAKGRGCHVFKKDLWWAYRQIPIDPQDYPLLGLYIDGSLCFHTALPFGLRSATMICQRTTKSVAYILNTEGISVDVYIDNFYGAESNDLSDLSFQRMNSFPHPIPENPVLICTSVEKFGTLRTTCLDFCSLLDLIIIKDLFFISMEKIIWCYHLNETSMQTLCMLLFTFSDFFVFFLLLPGVKVSKFFLWLSIVKSAYSTGQMSYSKCGDYIWVTGIYGHCTVEGKTLSIEDITKSVLQSLSGK